MIPRMLRYTLLGISIILIWGSMGFADSLWKRNSESLFSAPKSNQVGSVITIYISVNSSAVQSADTNTSKQSSVGTNLLDSWQQVAQVIGSDENLRRTKQVNISGGDKYTGGGKTSRSSKVESVMTAVVTEVFENGNMYIVGERNVKVNDELETISISGVVRPQDISPENTVYSYQIAKAEISVKGTGAVGSKQTPGVLTKLLNWFF